MRNSTALLFSVCLAASLQVFAAEPPAAVEKVAGAAPESAPAPTAAVNPDKDKPVTSADAAKTVADDDVAAKARDKRFIGMGYKPTKRDGVTMYCRKEAVVGTRFSRMICGTAENLDRTAENAQQETDRMVRRSLNQLPSN